MLLQYCMSTLTSPKLRKIWGGGGGGGGGGEGAKSYTPSQRGGGGGGGGARGCLWRISVERGGGGGGGAHPLHHHPGSSPELDLQK